MRDVLAEQYPMNSRTIEPGSINSLEMQKTDGDPDFSR